MTLSVIIPAYNEARTLGPVLERVRSLPDRCEIVIVDDASTDGTSEVLAALAGPDLLVVRMPCNGGKGSAVREGLKRCTGDIVAIQDADLELDPSVLPGLCEPVRLGRADAVFGARFTRPNGAGFVCRAANSALTRLANRLFGARLSDLACGHKVIRREVLERLGLRATGFEIEAEIAARLLRMGARITEAPVPYAPRTRAEGKKTRYLRDGLRAALTLLRVRFGEREPDPAEAIAP